MAPPVEAAEERLPLEAAVGARQLEAAGARRAQPASSARPKRAQAARWQKEVAELPAHRARQAPPEPHRAQASHPERTGRLRTSRQRPGCC